MANTRRAQGAGSVYLRKDGRYAAAALFEGKRITKYGKTKKDAWDNLQAALDDLKAGRVVLGPKMTVKEFLTHWLEDEHRLEIELTSLDEYRSILRVHLIPAFGHLQLSQVTRQLVQSFVAEKLDSGLSPARVRQICALLSAGMSVAVERDLLVKNPCSGVVQPRLGRKKPKVLSRDECTRLVDAAKGRRLWFLLLVGITTGARIGELLALRWSDIDLNNLRIHIHHAVSRVLGMGIVDHDTKSASGARQVMLSQVVIDAMNEQKAFIARMREKAGGRWQEQDLVFPNRHGTYMRHGTINSELREVLALVGLDPRSFHKLRHSFATLLFAAGVNPKVVSEALGHSNISITLGMYGDVTPDMQQEVGAVMDRMFEG